MRKLALISVSDKSGLLKFADHLIQNNWRIISTGGTYSALLNEFGNRMNKMPQNQKLIQSVEEYCKTTEFLGGRVKTLNEHIHGGLLAKTSQLAELTLKGFTPIDLLVANLYPFSKVINSTGGCTMEDAIENIDIGGVAMLRGAAKNYERVTVVSDPADYEGVIEMLSKNNNDIPLDARKTFAVNTFKLTAEYDARIAEYLSGGTIKSRMYTKSSNLKYGCNPHQSNASVWKISGDNYPNTNITTLNGKPSYINYLDAINGWQLVTELHAVTGFQSAASYKHTSPAGVALGAYQLSQEESLAYRVEPKCLSEQALAYIRARNGDPKSSFGDFIACSGIVDVDTANYIKNEVSDGIIAKGYTPDALNILRKKKSGSFIILQGPTKETSRDSYVPVHPKEEFREMGGVVLSQQPNYPDAKWYTGFLLNNITSTISNDTTARQMWYDSVLSLLTLKYTQSNSVSLVTRGQTIGIGCGQQNRVDCVKLAGEKSKIWHQRQTQEAFELINKWKLEGIKGQNLTNKLYDYFELSSNLSGECNKKMSIVLASDGFFPFDDNVIKAKEYNVTHIIQPGGSTADAQIEETIKKLGMTQLKTGKRLFYH